MYDRTDSKDLDGGEEDIWLVKFAEENTSINPDVPEGIISVYLGGP